MTESDPLMAALRQSRGGKVILRATSRSAPIAKDVKGKVDQFREQLQLIAQGAKHGSRPDVKGEAVSPTKDVEKVATQSAALPDDRGEVIDPGTTRSKARVRQSAEDSSDRADKNSSHHADREVTSSPEWRCPEAALSSVISRLDQAQALSPRDDGTSPREVPSQTRVEQKEMSLNPGEATKAQKADAVPEQRFASSMGEVETRTVPAVKVVVREQETHFEPVQQVTLLQKIVDRIAPDVATTAAPPGTSSAEVALPGMHRVTDTPVRMLTLQLDPPNMGTVTVRMRLAGDAVEVRLLADRHETTQLLREERGALMDAMQSAGYTFDIASIDQTRTSDPNAGAGQSQQQSDQRQSPQAQSGPQIDSGTAERQSSDAQAGTRHNRQGHDQLAEGVERHQDEEIVRDSNGGALYL